MTAENAADIPMRDGYVFFTSLRTRWSDNDMLGHLNNVIYNRFFEATVVDFYADRMPYDVHTSATLPFVVEVLTRFRRPLSFPDVIEGGLRVERLGTSSVRYGLALFRQGEDQASAHGHLVHVFVDREMQMPVAIPQPLRDCFVKHLVG